MLATLHAERPLSTPLLVSQIRVLNIRIGIPQPRDEKSTFCGPDPGVPSATGKVCHPKIRPMTTMLASYVEGYLFTGLALLW